MSKHDRDFWCGVVTLIFSVLLFIASFSVKQFVTEVLGPEFMPRLVAVVLFILSILLILTNISARKEGGPEYKEQPIKTNLPLIMTIILLVLYALAIKPFGYPISTSIYLTLQMLLLTQWKFIKKQILLFVLISVVSAGTIYTLFYKIFYVFLPTGTIW